MLLLAGFAGLGFAGQRARGEGSRSQREAGRSVNRGIRGAHTIPNAFPASVKAAIAKSMSASVSAADIWVRMRAWPFGTTGKKKPATNNPRSSRA